MLGDSWKLTVSARVKSLFCLRVKAAPPSGVGLSGLVSWSSPPPIQFLCSLAARQDTEPKACCSPVEGPQMCALTSRATLEGRAEEGLGGVKVQEPQ